MTGPTREEVERVRCELMKHAPIRGHRAVREEAASMLAALRERLEAAEAEVLRQQGRVAIRDGECQAKAQIISQLEAALTEARAREAAAWEACANWVDAGIYMGSDGKGKASFKPMTGAYLRSVCPTDATAALTAVKDAEWNAAIEAAAEEASTALLRLAPVAIPFAIRALRRNPKEGV
ncbi:hypothetical protein KLEP181_gp54 [Paracoccus phage vB_PmaP_KLEP18-1]|nr:hypothetical protein KLEP181_gp54 [Paracoccus phage vB_PmaP_KLEP18-1]